MSTLYAHIWVCICSIVHESCVMFYKKIDVEGAEAVMEHALQLEGLHVCVYTVQYVMHDRDVNYKSGYQSRAMINMIILFSGAKQPLGQC